MDKHFIKASIRKIKEASDNNKLVVFVGAGVSANSGIPLWGQLIRDFANDLNIEISEGDNSLETFLKIPQYYYNERGEKEYFDKLNEVFLSKKYNINPIHEEIFKLSPTHIVTTNYDDLLEKAAMKYAGYYHTVREDFDLPYDVLNKMIIKMHGDFNKKNIVLKEDDYLSYSTNFKLIENYLKSLIATNVVLFIGYSANDPNFKLIFQWVKGLLKSHFQPAYLLEVSNKSKYMEFNYYKNRGINILYYNEVEQSVNKNNQFPEHNFRGNNSYDFLKYINDFYSSDYCDDTDIVYNQLKKFERFNFIMASDLIKALGLTKKAVYDYQGRKELMISEKNNPLIRIFSEQEVMKNNDKKIELIIETLKKANINAITDFERTIVNWEDRSTVDDKSISNIIDIRFTDYRKSFSSFINVEMTSKSYYEALEKAYLFYKFGKYHNAYKLYKKISRNSFESRDYAVHFISEFNRKYLGEIVDNQIDSNEISEEEIEIIAKEAAEINLESIYSKLPKKEQRSLEFLKNLSNFAFIYKTKYELDQTVESIKKAREVVIKGGGTTNYSIIKLIHLTENLWSFINYNYLCIEHYSEVKNLYKSFIEGVLASYSTKLEGKETRNNFFSSLKPARMSSLNKFSVYLMVLFIKDKELDELFENYAIDTIDIDGPGKNYLLDSLANIVKAMSKKKSIDEDNRYLCNILILLSRIKMNSKEYKIVIENIISLLKTDLVYLNEEEYINSFIFRQSKQGVLDEQSTINLLVEYLSLCVGNPRLLEYYRGIIYRNLIRILKDNYKSTLENPIIVEVIGHAKKLLEQKSIHDLCIFFTSILIPIYEVVGRQVKLEIQECIQKFMLLMENDYFSLEETADVYYFSTIKEILPSNKSSNKWFLNQVLKAFHNNKETSYSSVVMKKIHMLTDLYRFGHIEASEIKAYINDLKGYSPYFDFIFCVESCNIETLDINTFLILKTEELINVMSNEKINEAIYTNIEEHLLQNLKSNQDKSVFQEFYVRKYGITKTEKFKSRRRKSPQVNINKNKRRKRRNFSS
ncbi:SIR2 family protein [Pseudobacillus badius]|uniref:SIR2 family protein n=1 Tax=Bacillus badius TaxID=1455 RepID=UPI0007B3364E|nr:SIR2 family protein [Bacillus badius]KZR57492.1 hypothetical protein A3781_20030 [Bacillus badius]